MTTIPIFPLQLVVFETEKIHLHIFESRYKRLIQDCLDDNREFGIAIVKEQKILDIGTIVNISKIVERYDNGDLDIICVGKQRFSILETYPTKNEKSYSWAEVDLHQYTHNEDKELSLRLVDLIKIMLEAMQEKNDGWFNNHDRELENNFDFYNWCHKIGLTQVQEIELHQLSTFASRQALAIEYLKNFIEYLEIGNAMREKIKLNGHFKRLPQSF